MSNGSATPPPPEPPEQPESTGSTPHGRRRRKPLVAVAALVPLCVAGVLVWLVTKGPDDGGGGEQAAASQQPDKEDVRKNAAKRGKPLLGKHVVVDPGHNPHNRDHLDKITSTVKVGTEDKECDNTGTTTDSGYAEASFTLDLAREVREDLAKQGAEVTFTQDGDTSYGPCVDKRAEMGNRIKADASISLHADGAPPGARGFHVIIPAAVHEKGLDNRAIVKPSRQLGTALASAFRKSTGARPADYVNGGKGLDARDDLVGLNLSSVPKVFLECGNMRDPQDAEQLTDPGWRARAAEGISKGIAAYLSGER